MLTFLWLIVTAKSDLRSDAVNVDCARFSDIVRLAVRMLAEVGPSLVLTAEVFTQTIKKVADAGVQTDEDMATDAEVQTEAARELVVHWCDAQVDFCAKGEPRTG